MCPSSEDCTPNKVTGSVPLECSSGPETPKLLVINPVFVGKKRVFADFAIKTGFFLFWSSSQSSLNFTHISEKRIFLCSSLSISREKSFCAPPKIVYCPLSHATLAPRPDFIAVGNHNKTTKRMILLSLSTIPRNSLTAA